jgi:hypothetical protein
MTKIVSIITNKILEHWSEKTFKIELLGNAETNKFK